MPATQNPETRNPFKDRPHGVAARIKAGQPVEHPQSNGDSSKTKNDASKESGDAGENS